MSRPNWLDGYNIDVPEVFEFDEEALDEEAVIQLHALGENAKDLAEELAELRGEGSLTGRLYTEVGVLQDVGMGIDYESLPED